MKKLLITTILLLISISASAQEQIVGFAGKDLPVLNEECKRINKEIDQGDIIIQRTIPIKREDTEHRLFLKCSAIAIPMLLESIKRIENYPFVRIKQEKDGSYFSLPTKDAVRAFKRRGHKVLKIKDFLDGEKIVSDFIQC